MPPGYVQFDASTGPNDDGSRPQNFEVLRGLQSYGRGDIVELVGPKKSFKHGVMFPQGLRGVVQGSYYVQLKAPLQGFKNRDHPEGARKKKLKVLFDLAELNRWTAENGEKIGLGRGMQVRESFCVERIY